MGIYTKEDSFRCPNCGEGQIGLGNLVEHATLDNRIFECDECSWQGDNPENWEFYSHYDTREEERGLK